MHNITYKSKFFEFIIIIVFLILFCIFLYTLVFAGTLVQTKIVAEKDAQIASRIALSYINVRIRQNDVRDKIRIKRFDNNEKNAIIIRERGEFGDYDVWIYWSDGALREAVSNVDEQPIDSSFNNIIEIDDFEVELKENGILIITILYKYNNETQKITNKIYLRSY